ncbi:MAG TPA: hypothetical protein VMZ31_19975 [Phycisphaerae bacterium]|nr:hypothetical protein [Phycisphaerae bacterium]
MRLVLVMLGGAVIVMAACPSALAVAGTGTSPLSDCYGTGKCGPAGTYCDCGTCIPPNGEMTVDERCYYVIYEVSPNFDVWEYRGSKTCEASACNSTGTGNSCDVAEAQSEENTATSSYGWSISNSVTAQVNLDLLIGGSIEWETGSGYEQGTSHSSSKTVSYSQSCTSNAPPCGKVKGYRSVFRRDAPASTSIGWTLQQRCNQSGELCCDWHAVSWSNGNCSMTAQLTEGTGSTFRCVQCDLTCGGGELHSNCEGSSTHSDPEHCAYMTPPS